MSLLADDTSPWKQGWNEHQISSHEGRNEQIRVKEKAESNTFGLWKFENGNIRMLGCWMDPTIDIRNRIKRDGRLWAKLRRQLVNSMLTKRQQPIIIHIYVDSVLLFDVATSSWQNWEIKSTATMDWPSIPAHMEEQKGGTPENYAAQSSECARRQKFPANKIAAIKDRTERSVAPRICSELRQYETSPMWMLPRKSREKEQGCGPFLSIGGDWSGTQLWIRPI